MFTHSLAQLGGLSVFKNYFALFARFFDHLPVALYFSSVQNNRWQVELLSDGITRLLGYGSQEIIGTLSFPDLNMDKDDIYRTVPIRSDSTDHSEFSYLYTLRTKNNSLKRVMDKGILLFDSQGDLEGALGVLMEPTLDSEFDILEYIPEGFKVQRKSKSSLDEIIGRSQPMRKARDRILKIAHAGGHVLIEGESGTGKELTARAIHELSGSGGRPFIAINCGAISEQLIESEFFGHVKGAFSGASENRQGYLDVVNKGTLFLDEVGEMPINMQIKLLRVLDGYGYTPVGSTKVKNSLFRLICATNRDLNALVQAGMMRLDFYHRIKQLTITLPPLRERGEDIEDLIEAFSERFFKDNQLQPSPSQPIISQAVKERFLTYRWPGNVRELYHAVVKYLSMGEIDLGDAWPSPPPYPSPRQDDGFGGQGAAVLLESRPSSFSEFERDCLMEALNKARWDLAKTARLLGCSKRTVQRKVAKYNLK